MVEPVNGRVLDWRPRFDPRSLAFTIEDNFSSRYEGMFDTDEKGYIHPTGRVVGGHALCVGGVDPARERFRLDNSWGPGWGVNGSAWLTYADMDRLLHEDGEACLPRKVKP